MKENKLFWWVKVLAIFGIALAIYLLYEQAYQPAFQPCRINSTVNCDAVVSGPVKNTLGIPTPIYGLVGYIVMLFATLTKKKKLLLYTATFGLVFCGYIAYIELIQLHVVCPVCLGCDADILAMFTLAWLINKKPKGEII